MKLPFNLFAFGALQTAHRWQVLQNLLDRYVANLYYEKKPRLKAATAGGHAAAGAAFAIALVEAS